MTQQQKALAWMIGALLAVSLGAFAFLGGYFVRKTTEPASASAPAAVAAAAATAGAGSASASASGNVDFGVLQEIDNVLKANYVDPSRLQDQQALKQGAIDGLLNTVGDSHQVYVRPEDVQFEETDLSGQFEGIGATVQQKNGQVSIESLIPDYPAFKSGKLKPGDIILAVDGASMQGKTTTDAVKAIRGRAGTNVTISVQHNNGQKEDVTLTRAQILITSVHADALKDANGNPVTDLGYLRLSQFQQSTDKEVADYLKSIQGKGYKGLILDLRNNPGGYLQQTENILSDFLKPGQTVLITQDRNGKEKADKSAAQSVSSDLPLVVLVNKNSASASEITAGAIQDNGRGKVIGEQTFGKGTVNQFFPLPKDGGELYVSIARWLTPNHDQIEGKGITPDMVVHLADNDDPQSYFNAQLYAAIDYLHKANP
ncbi:MAG TPA: S41 family peptidase [Dehalococcoidia bacterium]|nr:S41 family peptidase [Dehalococcoidia bacterium]